MALLLYQLNTMDQSETYKPKCEPAKRLQFGEEERRKRVRDDFLMQSIKKSSRTSAVSDDLASCTN